MGVLIGPMYFAVIYELFSYQMPFILLVMICLVMIVYLWNVLPVDSKYE